MQRLELIPGLNRLFEGYSPESISSRWNGLTWGQDFGQVQRYFPKAAEEGGALKLSSEEGEVKKAWTLTFGFNSSRQLSSVSLSYAGGSETADFAELSQAISQRLGAPAQSTGNSQTWYSSGASFTLSRQPGGGLVLNKTT
jgi:hypothetical protein